MMDAASGTLDLNLHGYVMVDMDGFSELIDAMGGITVESGGWVPYRGRHPETNQWGNRWFEPGTLELDGDDALPSRVLGSTATTMPVSNVSSAFSRP